MSVIEASAPSDDVEDLMHSVQDSLRAWEAQIPGSQPDPVSDRPDDDLRQRAALLRHQWRVDSGAIIHSSRPRLGPFLVRMQAAVRRATRWFVDPVIQQIRQFQRNTARVVDELAGRQVALLERISELETRLALLEERVDDGASHESDGA